MTPEEREEWARRFSYREHISSNDVVAVGALLVPFMLLGFGVVALATGDGVGRIGGVLLLLLVGVVMTWAWHYFSSPFVLTTTRTSSGNCATESQTSSDDSAASSSDVPVGASSAATRRLGTATPVLVPAEPSRG